MADAPEFDYDKIDEVALALFVFAMHSDEFGMRAWKGLAWEITDRMYEKGWIGDPKSTAKSVALSEEGERLAHEFARKHFAAGK